MYSQPLSYDFHRISADVLVQIQHSEKDSYNQRIKPTLIRKGFSQQKFYVVLSAHGIWCYCCLSFSSFLHFQRVFAKSRSTNKAREFVTTSISIFHPTFNPAHIKVHVSRIIFQLRNFLFTLMPDKTFNISLAAGLTLNLLRKVSNLTNQITAKSKR